MRAGVRDAVRMFSSGSAFGGENFASGRRTPAFCPLFQLQSTCQEDGRVQRVSYALYVRFREHVCPVDAVVLYGERVVQRRMRAVRRAGFHLNGIDGAVGMLDAFLLSMPASAFFRISRQLFLALFGN